MPREPCREADPALCPAAVSIARVCTSWGRIRKNQGRRADVVQKHLCEVTVAESSPLGPRGSLTLQTWVPLIPGGSQHFHMRTIFWSRHPVSLLFFVTKALTAVQSQDPDTVVGASRPSRPVSRTPGDPSDTLFPCAPSRVESDWPRFHCGGRGAHGDAASVMQE